MPELRFPEFQDSENWKGCLLGEVASFSKGKGISKSDVTPDGKLPCIRYGQLYTHYKETIKEVISYTNLPLEELVLSKPNDVIIPASGETQLDIATASCIKKSGVALGGDLNIIRSKHDGVFLAYYLNSAKKNSIAQMAQGIAVVHLYANQLKNLEINLPEINEQQKIADCLSSLDELISAHTQKFDTLKAHKKGLMQQLFPAEGETIPKLRFPEFQKKLPWEKRSFSKLFEIGGGKDHKHLPSGNIPVYGSGGYMRSVNEFLYDGESACIGRKGTINKPMLLTGKFWTVDTLFYTHSFNGCTAKFIYLLFQNIDWLSLNEAGGVPSLSKVIINKIEVMIPEIKEQHRITDCIDSLEELITAQSQKIDALKAHKQGLMQQLFPTVGGDSIDAEDRATQNAEVEVSA